MCLKFTKCSIGLETINYLIQETLVGLPHQHTNTHPTFNRHNHTPKTKTSTLCIILFKLSQPMCILLLTTEYQQCMCLHLRQTLASCYGGKVFDIENLMKIELVKPTTILISFNSIFELSKNWLYHWRHGYFC